MFVEFSLASLSCKIMNLTEITYTEIMYIV